MSDNSSSTTVNAERQELEQTLTCVEQMIREFENMAARSRMDRAEMSVLAGEIQGRDRSASANSGSAGAPGDVPELEQSTARQKALGKELVDAASAFAQHLIAWAQEIEKRETLLYRPVEAAPPVTEAPTVQNPILNEPPLNSPGPTGPSVKSAPGEPEFPNAGPATVIAAAIALAVGATIAEGLTISEIFGKRAKNILNYRNPYGPGSTFIKRVGHTGGDGESPSDQPRVQVEPTSPPPPTIPPTLAPPGFPGDEPHNHHEFPRQFRDWFEASPRNINIDDYITKMPQQWHMGAEISIHSNGYNPAWDVFMQENPNATYIETVNFMNALKNSMGFGLGY